jgi:2-isopropylmalate synthase
MNQTRQIKIFDTTLRDGEQSPGCSMNAQEKLRLARQLDRLGVDILEAGFPIASEGDFTAVQTIARTFDRPVIAALARASEHDITLAWKALKDAAHPRIHIFLATSEIHLQHKLRISRQQCLEQARRAVALAKTFCDDIEFSPEDATRTEPEFLFEILEAVIAEGATTLNIPDTVGYAVPHEYAQLLTNIQKTVCGADAVTISTHCHNDLGLAVANSLAGVNAGARQIECTINGIGERAGNAALEELVMAMRVRVDYYGFETNIQASELFPTSQMLAEITGMQVQPNKAIVGRNAFAHEAGIHQDGMLKNSLTYEIMTPVSVGVPESRLVLGKHSGRHALSLRCAALGYELDRRELDDVYRKFVVLADEIKTVQDHHLEAILRDISRTQRPALVKKPALAKSSALAAATSTLGSASNGSKKGSRFTTGNPTVDVIPRSTDRHREHEDYLWGV